MRRVALITAIAFSACRQKAMATASEIDADPEPAPTLAATSSGAMPNTIDAFERANQLWYAEGRTARARSAYEDARRAQPSDPVVAFQFARVSWSLGDMVSVRSSLAICHKHRDELTPNAQSMVERWRVLALRQAPPADSSGIAIELLDRDRLESVSMPAAEWRKIARAAGDRELYAVAIFAFERSKRAPFDVHDEDEARWWSNLLRDRDLDAALLKSMRKRAPML